LDTKIMKVRTPKTMIVTTIPISSSPKVQRVTNLNVCIGAVSLRRCKRKPRTYNRKKAIPSFMIDLSRGGRAALRLSVLDLYFTQYHQTVMKKIVEEMNPAVRLLLKRSAT